MDARMTIMQKVTEQLQDKVSDEVMDLIQDAIMIELNKYEVQERCTEVSTVGDNAATLLRRFIATKQVEGLSESTLRRYADENWKMITFIRKPIEQITTYDLRYYLSYKRKTGKVSNRTLDGMRRCYSSFFSFLSAEGAISINPCSALSQIKYRKTVQKPFSAVEMEKLREACSNTRDLALIDFLYCTGCRVSEVVKLDISDIDFEREECIVIGKGNKERTVYLSDVASMHLSKYLSERDDESDALFIGKGSKRLSKNGIEAILTRLGKIAGVDDVHPHRFRRTLATNLLDRGMNIQDVAQILGHSDLKTTQIYCYISQANVKSAYKKYAA